jgi:hypothetical protein
VAYPSDLDFTHLPHGAVADGLRSETVRTIPRRSRATAILEQGLPCTAILESGAWDYVRALEQRDADMFRTAVAHLQTLLPHLSIKRRLILSVALICLGRFELASAAYKARRMVQPIARRLLLGGKAATAA